MTIPEIEDILRRIADLLVYAPCTCGYGTRRGGEAHSSSCASEQARDLKLDINKATRKAKGGPR